VAGWLDVDRAIVAAISARLFQLVAAPVTLFVIVRSFSSELQGFHYTFASLIALQSFAELGFSIVIINTASHEWAHLGLDSAGRINGDPAARSRLVSLGRLTSRWYGVASFLFVVIVSVVGLWFFGGRAAPGINWKAPWLALVVLAGCQLWMLAFTSILEGCNQIATVYRFRLAQAVLSNLAFWLAAILGAGLWAGVALAAARLCVDGTLIAVRYRRFFEAFRRAGDGPVFQWSTEIWPMQWRLALSGITNYFAFSLFSPVLFRYHGAVAAGRMGITLQAIGGIQSIAIVWLTTRVPSFGGFIARGDRAGLDRLWLQTSSASVAILGLGVLALWGLVDALNVFDPPIAARLLGLGPLTLLLAAAMLMQLSQAETAYMRAHRCEPIVVMSVTTNMMMGAAVWTLGRFYGAAGAAAGYLGVMAVMVVWESVIWWRFREVRSARVEMAG
jgi:hypothetical protein